MTEEQMGEYKMPEAEVQRRAKLIARGKRLNLPPLEHETAGAYETRLDNAEAALKNVSVLGLPVKGYKATQSAEAIAAVNVFKELEERALRHAEKLMQADPAIVDPRFMNIGKTQLQMAFMALNRAIFKPERVRLPEDDKE